MLFSEISFLARAGQAKLHEPEMTTRYQWQCCGCKALFSSQKNAKLHVSFHIRAEAAARAAAARAEQPPPPRPGGRGRGRGSATAGYRRPGRHAEPANLAAHASRSGPQARENHWPHSLDSELELESESGSEPRRLYQMIILDPQRGSARIVPLAVIAQGPGGADRDSDSDAAAAAGGRGGGGQGQPGPAAAQRQPALSDSDSDPGLTGQANWQEVDQEDDCPESVRGEPGEQYLINNCTIFLILYRICKILYILYIIYVYCTIFDKYCTILYNIYVNCSVQFCTIFNNYVQFCTNLYTKFDP